MRTFKFDKLIRDKLLQRMLDIGINVSAHETLRKHEVLRYYKTKLVEEAEEVLAAKDHHELVEEIADLTEALHELVIKSGIDPMEVEQARRQKKEEKDGFQNAIIIDKVMLDTDHEFTEYYSSRPNKYPEIQS